MAAPERQSNGLLYTVFAFVTLFVIAAVLAVIFYIGNEDIKAEAEQTQKQLNEIASSSEIRKLGELVGPKASRKSYLASMLEYVDQMAKSTLGTVTPEISADEKFQTSNAKVQEILTKMADKAIIQREDIENIGLVNLIEKLNEDLDFAVSHAVAMEIQRDELEQLFTNAMEANLDKEAELQTQMQNVIDQSSKIERSYAELKALMEQTANEQIQNVLLQLDTMKENLKNEHQELLKTQAQLTITEDKMNSYQEILDSIKPHPDKEVAAFKADGKVILVDNQANVVHLNIGASDHVYRGLTFGVYTKGMPIPKDGKGKAEIEVYSVKENISIAQIISTENNAAILRNDIIANLIWDSSETNIFVVAGVFDFDGNGITDRNAKRKITEMIENWGGKIDDEISIDTDFLVLGNRPKNPQKPSLDQIDIDPMAMEKYEEALQNHKDYQTIISQAQVLSVPVFNLDRFLYFIGYKSLQSR